MSVSPELRAGTLRLTAVALGLVLGLSAACVLPLLLPWRGQLLLTFVAVLLALVPFGALTLVFRRREQPLPEHWLPLALAVALAPAFALVPLFRLYRGEIRVLNHGDEPFTLFIDARRVARVEPSSGESALAGVQLTVPAGERELRVVAQSSGRELFRSRELVAGGSPHLFAPVSRGYCFSIERRGYGDATDQPLDVLPLEGDNPFWELPDGISWFTPNPEPGPLRTSGGTLSCLRQKRCQN